MSSIRHIIFDLSEVLIRGVAAFPEAVCRAVQSRHAIDLRPSWSGFGGRHMAEFLRGEITEDQYLEEVLLHNGWRIKKSDLKLIIRDNFQLTFPETIAVARDLAEVYELTLLSDHAHEWVACILERHAFISELFPRRIFSCDSGTLKSEPDTFLNLIQNLQAKPQECLFIDDHEQNVRVARLAGLAGIVFKNAAQLREDLEAIGVMPMLAEAVGS